MTNSVLRLTSRVQLRQLSFAAQYNHTASTTSTRLTKLSKHMNHNRQITRPTPTRTTLNRNRNQATINQSLHRITSKRTKRTPLTTVRQISHSQYSHQHTTSRRRRTGRRRSQRKTRNVTIAKKSITDLPPSQATRVHHTRPPTSHRTAHPSGQHKHSNNTAHHRFHRRFLTRTVMVSLNNITAHTLRQMVQVHRFIHSTHYRINKPTPTTASHAHNRTTLIFNREPSTTRQLRRASRMRPKIINQGRLTVRQSTINILPQHSLQHRRKGTHTMTNNPSSHIRNLTTTVHMSRHITVRTYSTQTQIRLTITSRVRRFQIRHQIRLRRTTFKLKRTMINMTTLSSTSNRPRRPLTSTPQRPNRPHMISITKPTRRRLQRSILTTPRQRHGRTHSTQSLSHSITHKVTNTSRRRTTPNGKHNILMNIQVRRLTIRVPQVLQSIQRIIITINSRRHIRNISILSTTFTPTRNPTTLTHKHNHSSHTTRTRVPISTRTTYMNLRVNNRLNIQKVIQVILQRQRILMNQPNLQKSSINHTMSTQVPSLKPRRPITTSTITLFRSSQNSTLISRHTHHNSTQKTNTSRNNTRQTHKHRRRSHVGISLPGELSAESAADVTIQLHSSGTKFDSGVSDSHVDPISTVVSVADYTSQ